MELRRHEVLEVVGLAVQLRSLEDFMRKTRDSPGHISHTAIVSCVEFPFKVLYTKYAKRRLT